MSANKKAWKVEMNGILQERYPGVSHKEIYTVSIEEKDGGYRAQVVFLKPKTQQMKWGNVKSNKKDAREDGARRVVEWLNSNPKEEEKGKPERSGRGSEISKKEVKSNKKDAQEDAARRAVEEEKGKPERSGRGSGISKKEIEVKEGWKVEMNGILQERYPGVSHKEIYELSVEEKDGGYRAQVVFLKPKTQQMKWGNVKSNKKDAREDGARRAVEWLNSNPKEEEKGKPERSGRGSEISKKEVKSNKKDAREDGGRGVVQCLNSNPKEEEKGKIERSGRGSGISKKEIEDKKGWKVEMNGILQERYPGVSHKEIYELSIEEKDGGYRAQVVFLKPKTQQMKWGNVKSNKKDAREDGARRAVEWLNSNPKEEEENREERKRE